MQSPQENLPTSSQVATEFAEQEAKKPSPKKQSPQLKESHELSEMKSDSSGSDVAIAVHSSAAGPPLPTPRWEETTEPILELTLQEYHNVARGAQEILRNLLEEEIYDSVNGLITFYDAYKRENKCLYNFFKDYTPKINDKNLTCVGMAVDLIQRWHELDPQFPNFAKSCMLVSCEQEVSDVDQYISFERPECIPKVDKEHVLVGVNVKIDGRVGVLLADPGFHIARIITVMLDKDYPHTGMFIQSDAPDNYKEYNYYFNERNPEYVEWHDKKMARGITMQDTALIYISKRYLEGVNVTIRRNIVYEFKSLLARAKTGEILGGVYFKIRHEDPQFTIMSANKKKKKNKTRYNFSIFTDGQELPAELKEDLVEVNALLGLQDGELTKILHKIAVILQDTPFLNQMFAINTCIQLYDANKPWPQM